MAASARLIDFRGALFAAAFALLPFSLGAIFWQLHEERGQTRSVLSGELETLSRSRFSDLEAGRFRDFSEGVGAALGASALEIRSAEGVFTSGSMGGISGLLGVCAEKAVPVGGGGKPVILRACMRGRSGAGTVVFLTVFLLGVALFGVLILLRRLEVRSNEVMQAIFRGYGLPYDREQGLDGIHRRLGSVTEEMKALREKELRGRVARSQSELALRIIHDLKSPIAALRVASRSLKSDPDLSELLKATLERVTSMSSDLLRSARNGSDQASLPDSGGGCVLGDLLESVISEKKLVHQEAGPRIEPISGAELAALDLPFPKAELGRVFSNLIDNAIDASAIDTVVRVRVGRARDRVEVMIEDEGSGIPGPVLGAFGSSPLSSGKRDGNGLGVFSAAEILRSLGGILEVAATGATGTSLRVSLPLTW